MAQQRRESQDPWPWDSLHRPDTPRPFWDSLDGADHRALEAIGQPVSYDAQQIVPPQGETLNQVVIVRTGWITTTTADADEREPPLRVYGPGDVLGQFPALTGQPPYETARTLTDVEALTIPGRSFTDFLIRHPNASLALHRIQALRLHDADRRGLDKLTSARATRLIPAAASPIRLDFRVLGPVEVRVDGRRVELGYAKNRLILAALLLNERVSVERLIEVIWGNCPPRTCRTSLYTYISRLRTILHKAAPDAPRLVRASPDAYFLDINPEQVDLHRFRHLVAEGRRVANHDDAKAVQLLREGLRQWQALPWRGGEPLGGLPPARIANYREILTTEVRDAFLDCTRAELRLGLRRETLSDLAQLADYYPYDEAVTALLMIANYRDGRYAEAIEMYHRTSRRLADELGLDPGPQLTELLERILNHDPALQGPTSQP